MRFQFSAEGNFMHSDDLFDIAEALRDAGARVEEEKAHPSSGRGVVTFAHPNEAMLRDIIQDDKRIPDDYAIRALDQRELPETVII